MEPSEWDDTANTEATSCETASSGSSDLSEKDLLGNNADDPSSPGQGIQHVSLFSSMCQEQKDLLSRLIYFFSKYVKLTNNLVYQLRFLFNHNRHTVAQFSMLVHYVAYAAATPWDNKRIIQITNICAWRCFILH